MERRESGREEEGKKGRGGREGETIDSSSSPTATHLFLVTLFPLVLRGTSDLS